MNFLVVFSVINESVTFVSIISSRGAFAGIATMFMTSFFTLCSRWNYIITLDSNYFDA